MISSESLLEVCRGSRRSEIRWVCTQPNCDEYPMMCTHPACQCQLRHCAHDYICREQFLKEFSSVPKFNPTVLNSINKVRQLLQILKDKTTALQEKHESMLQANIDQHYKYDYIRKGFQDGSKEIIGTFNGDIIHKFIRGNSKDTEMESPYDIDAEALEQLVAKTSEQFDTQLQLVQSLWNPQEKEKIINPPVPPISPEHPLDQVSEPAMDSVNNFPLINEAENDRKYILLQDTEQGEQVSMLSNPHPAYVPLNTSHTLKSEQPIPAHEESMEEVCTFMDRQLTAKDIVKDIGDMKSVRMVNCSSEKWNLVAKELRKLKVKKLEMNSCRLLSKDIDKFNPAFEHLTSLTIEFKGRPQTAEKLAKAILTTAKDLVDFEFPYKKEGLDLGSCNLGMHECLLLVTAFPNLKVLEIKNNRVGAEGVRLICGLQNLEFLDIENNDIQSEGASLVLSTLPKLDMVDMRNNNISMLTLEKRTIFKDMSISNNLIQRSDYAAIGQCMPELEILRIDLRRDFFSALLEMIEGLHRLERLELTNERLTPEMSEDIQRARAQLKVTNPV